MTSDQPEQAPQPEDQPVHSPGEPAEEASVDASEMASQAVEQAEHALKDLKDQADGAPMDLPDFQPQGGAEGLADIRLLADVNVNVKIELGRTRMLVEDVLRLSNGAVVELDKLAGDPVDIYVNERPIARGEVLVLNDNFCVRVNEILSGPRTGEKPNG